MIPRGRRLRCRLRRRRRPIPVLRRTDATHLGAEVAPVEGPTVDERVRRGAPLNERMSDRICRGRRPSRPIIAVSRGALSHLRVEGHEKQRWPSIHICAGHDIEVLKNTVMLIYST